MARKNLRHILWLTVALLIAISLLPVAVFAAEVRAANPQDLGLTVTITGDGSMSNADGVYTATITKGYKAATIKITNNTDKKMRVSFTYTPSNARGVTLDNVSVNTSGDQTCNKNLAGGASIEIKVNSQRSSAGDAILVLKDFAAEELLPTTSQIAIEGNGSGTVRSAFETVRSCIGEEPSEHSEEDFRLWSDAELRKLLGEGDDEKP